MFSNVAGSILVELKEINFWNENSLIRFRNPNFTSKKLTKIDWGKYHWYNKMFHYYDKLLFAIFDKITTKFICQINIIVFIVVINHFSTLIMYFFDGGHCLTCSIRKHYSFLAFCVWFFNFCLLPLDWRLLLS